MTIFGTRLQATRLDLHAERIDLDDSPEKFFAKAKEDRENAFLLESAKGDDRLAEYSFVGFDPSKLIRVKDGLMEVDDMLTGSRDRMKTNEPLDELRRLVPPDSVGGRFRFVGGAVGYVSYDAIRYWERIPSTAKDSHGLPDMEFGIYTDGVVFDHAKREAYYYTLGRNRVDEVRRITRKTVGGGALHRSKATLSIDRSRFEDIVRSAKDYILSGDIFQAVLSKRYDFEAEGELSRFYSALRRINPSPYMYFVKFGDRRVVGSSPEMLVRVEDRRVETFPIAGTRPRMKDEKENARMTKELLADQKEKAEHIMLVDLARNDVGRVTKFGSVNVPEFLTVQQFSHVQHIVSHVVGDLRDGFDSFDALRALFPAGTVSGAPKVRAMEIIEELEGERRGPYAGAVGYFSFNGNSDFAITIRTLVANGRRCSVQSGAGIVADSEPEREWAETEDKAAGLMKAMELAEGDD